MKGYLTFVLLAFPTISFAYLDPGSGNALVYLLVSLGGACVYFVKNAYYKILALFGKKQVQDFKENADIILFSEGATYWFTFKPLIEELIARGIPFQYLSLDVKDPGLTIDHPLMYSRFMGFGAGAYARVAQCRGKLFFATTPNIGCESYPLPRPKNIEKMVHLSHTVGDITYLKKGSLDHYDVNLDIGPWCETRMRLVEKNRSLKPKEFHSVGLLYLDELQKSAKRKEVISEQITVLVAPSWGDKSCLRVHGASFVTDLLRAGLRVILRPHPQSYKFDADLIQQVIDLNKGFENFSVNQDINASACMQAADILISDSSSFRFDFAFLQNKPVITMLVPAGNLSSFEAGDLGGPWETEVVPKLGAVVEPKASVDLPALVRKLASTENLEIESLYNELIVNHGMAAKAVVDWIEKQE